jgi:DnaK suppressor protein
MTDTTTGLRRGTSGRRPNCKNSHQYESPPDQVRHSGVRYELEMEEPSARSLLESERLSASVRVDELTTEVAWLAGDSEDANGDDEHDPEGPTLAFERARVAALLADAEIHLMDLDRALAKLAAGTYGRCEVCGAEIPQGRLEALPATRTCISCATAARNS